MRKPENEITVPAEIKKLYPVRININRREIDYALHRPDHNSDIDFNLEIRVICDRSSRSFGTITIPAGGLMAAMGNRAEIRAQWEFEQSAEYFGLGKVTKEIWIRAQPKKAWDEEPKLPPNRVADGWMYSGGYGKKTEVRNGVTHHLITIYRYEPAEEE